MHKIEQHLIKQLNGNLLVDCYDHLVVWR